MLAVVGLVGLVGWYAYGFARDVQFLHGLQVQDAVVAGPMTIWWALRFGLPVVVVALACVALLQTMRDRSVRGWSIAVLAVLLGPVVLTGTPIRLRYLPYYLFSALYLVLALSAYNPRSET